MSHSLKLFCVVLSDVTCSIMRLSGLGCCLKILTSNWVIILKYFGNI